MRWEDFVGIRNFYRLLELAALFYHDHYQWLTNRPSGSLLAPEDHAALEGVTHESTQKHGIRLVAAPLDFFGLGMRE